MERAPPASKHEDIAAIVAILTKEGIISLLAYDHTTIGKVTEALRSAFVTTLEFMLVTSISVLGDNVAEICQVVESATLTALEGSGLGRSEAHSVWAENVEMLNGFIMQILEMMVSQTLLHLAHSPEGVEELRREIIQVLSADGWKKASFQKLKLVDSAVKEAQRLKPILEPREYVTLSNGLTIPKSQLTAVDTAFYQDPSLFSEPEKFHMRRFYEMRQQPGGEHKSQLVTVSPTDMAFGYGYRGCPGRFFASNEVKLALCHLLLEYDWGPALGTTTEPAHVGNNPMINPKAELLYKRCTPEIDLDRLIVDDAGN
ncbi:hypothetical protein MAPG_08744 [Magnaporthiopsis poae ATCC 64411]|uniref:Ent-kaurene oxidase n=1 Tax=Magnaporthiopsis poae (strain ATCC 64411 / 73-15) TaxID=644358 RepID=A0A0C4E856_MAGP6|nr:hypothetical protein MAPG_08744 [Magnaporthiopsis poae ATCC 64411]